MTKRKIAISTAICALVLIITASLTIHQRQKNRKAMEGELRVVEGTFEHGKLIVNNSVYLYLVDAQNKYYWLKWMKPSVQYRIKDFCEGDLLSAEGTVWSSKTSKYIIPGGSTIDMTDDFGGSDYVMLVDSIKKTKEDK